MNSGGPTSGASDSGGPEVRQPALSSNVPVIATRWLRGRKGSLQNMPDMPLDVLADIFSFLHPRDLLNLARTSKSFRSYLMNRSNELHWKAARANVEGLPDCPSYMSEPAYANLAFSPHCHTCLKPAVHPRRIFFEFAVRLCRECESKLFIGGDDEETDRFLSDITEITGRRPPFNTWVEKYFRPELDEFRLQWEQTTSTEAREQLVIEKAASAKLASDLSTKFNMWSGSRLWARQKELDELKASRLESIVTRLRQSGWTDELRRMDPRMLNNLLKREPFAKKAAELTDRGWENIRAQAFEWVTRIRDKRLRVEHQKILWGRFTTFRSFTERWLERRRPKDEDLSEQLDGLKFMDYALLPPVANLLNFSNQANPTTSDLEDLFKRQMKDLIAGWNRERRAELVAKLKRIYTSPQMVGDPIRLATSLFDCTLCTTRLMAYPDVLAHRCGIPTSRALEILSYEAFIVDYAALYNLEGAWNPDYIHVHSHAFPNKVRALIRACGLNPDVATHHDMDKCRKRMTCGDCTRWGQTKQGGYEVFDWRRALLHQDGEKHAEASMPCQWVILPEEAASVIRDFEESYAQRYYCAVGDCDKVFRIHEMRDLLTHLRRKHAIAEQNVREKDYWEDSSPPQRVYMYHRKTGKVEVAFEK